MPVVTVAGDVNASAGYSVLPEGTYDMMIESNDTTVSKTGTPQTKLSCKIIGGDDQSLVGRKASVFLSHHTNAIGFLRAFLDGSGVNYELCDTPAGPGLSFDTDHLNGLCVRGLCTHREWEGKTRENWGDWTPYQAQQPAQPARPAPYVQPNQQLQAPPGPPTAAVHQAGAGAPPPRMGHLPNSNDA